MDYYRGKVKSVYEKEPAFKDFYRNIPLSETNFYDSHNLTRIKHRFNNLVQNKMGRDQMNSRYDPYTPSGVRNMRNFMKTDDCNIFSETEWYF